MLIVKLKRIKLGTILTTLDPALTTPIEDQRKAVANFATRAPRVIVNGPEAPGKADGLRHMKTGPKPNLTNLLGTYMQTIPGAEVVMITNPDLLITGDIAPLLAYVDGLRMEMAWGCHLDANGKPVAFILSSQVVAHLLNDIPQSMTFADDWKGWVHAWMQRLLRHRYFDATSYAIVTPIPAQVEAVSVPTVFVENPEAHPVKVSHAKPKRGNVRRVKVA